MGTEEMERGAGGVKGKETEEMDKSFLFWVLGQNFPSLCSRFATKSTFGAREVDDVHFHGWAMSGGDASLTWTERSGAGRGRSARRRQKMRFLSQVFCRVGSFCVLSFGSFPPGRRQVSRKRQMAEVVAKEPGVWEKRQRASQRS